MDLTGFLVAKEYRSYFGMSPVCTENKCTDDILHEYVPQPPTKTKGTHRIKKIL